MSGLLLVVKFSSLFQAVCFEIKPLNPRLAGCYLFPKSFERFAPFSVPLKLFFLLLPTVSGLFRTECSRVLNFSTPFRAVCSGVLKFPSVFGAVCSLFSNFLISSEKLGPGVLKLSSPFRVVGVLFSNSLVSFERFAPCSQTLCSLSSGSLPLLTFPSLFRAVC